MTQQQQQQLKQHEEQQAVSTKMFQVRAVMQLWMGCGLVWGVGGFGFEVWCLGFGI